jgi:Major Facilitator Superfamily
VVATAAGSAVGATPPPPEKATFRDVFAVAEFRALWLAQLLSVAGDQLARVAMTVLVYDRTRSPLWTAVTYAVTFLPWLIGGLALSGLADRLPRRQVMVACDVARIVLVCLMALVSARVVSDSALGLLVVLLFVVTLLDSPFKSARSALLPDILTGERYVLGTALSQITLQIGMVSGFALGGLVVVLLAVRGALFIDAGTFAASALLVWFGVRRRPAAAVAAAAEGDAASAGSRPRQRAEIAAGIRLVFGDRRLRTLVLFGWLVAFYVVPQSLAVPYAARFHGLPLAVTAGLIFAAGPFGTMAGSIAFSRLVPAPRRQLWMGPLAVCCCAALVLCILQARLVITLVILIVSGTCAAYQLAANTAFVAAVPAERRGQAFGLANGGMQVLQGLWFVAAGATAVAVAPAVVIAISGGIGAVIAAWLARSWRHRPAGISK